MEGIAASPQLQAALDGRIIDGTPLRYETPNLPTMRAMLDFIVKPGGTRADGTPYLTKAETGPYGEIQRRLKARQRADRLTGAVHEGLRQQHPHITGPAADDAVKA